ncbi:MAG: hypothetical protein AAF358_13770 [Pseudomonadota bacterium]
MTTRIVAEFLDTVNGVSAPQYVADIGYTTSNAGSPANTLIEGRLAREININWRIGCIIWDGTESSRSTSSIRIANSDGRYDYLLTRDLRDQAVVVHEISSDTISSATRISVALIDRVDIRDRGELELVTFEKMVKLEVPLLSETYDGSQANPLLTGLSRPLAIGNCENVRPVIIDAPNLVYETNPTELTQIVNVRDRGAVLAPPNADNPGYTTVFDQFTLTNNPDGQITASIFTASTAAFSVVGTDELNGVGDFENWTGGVPDGWTYTAGFIGNPGTLAESGAGGQVEFTASLITNPSQNTDQLATSLNIDLIPGEEYQYTITVVSESNNVNPTEGIQSVRLTVNSFQLPGQNLLGAGAVHPLAAGTYSGVFVAPARAPGPIEIQVLSFGDPTNPGQIVLDNLTIERVQPDTSDDVPDVVRDLIFRAGFEADDFDDTEAVSLQSEIEYALNLYVHPDDPITVRQALEQVTNSFAGFSYVDNEGKFHVDKLRPALPAATPTVVDLREINGDLKILQDRAPGLSARLGVDRNWHPLRDGDVAGVVLEDENQRLTQDYLKIVEASDVEVLAPGYSFAKTAAPRGTLLRDYDGSPQLQIDHEVGLYGQLRYFYEITGALDPSLAKLQPGQTVRLLGDRYGLDSGTDLLVVGVDANYQTGVTKLTLWGTAPRYRTEATAYTGSQSTRIFGLTMPDSNQITVCFCMQADDYATGSEQMIFRCIENGGAGDFYARVRFNGDLQIVGENDAGTTRLNVAVQAPGFVNGAKYSVLLAIDMLDQVLVWINGRAYPTTVTTFTSDSIDPGTIAHIANLSGLGTTQTFGGSISHVGIWFDRAVDLLDPAVPLQYFDRYYRPLDGGDDGSLLNGTAPTLWFPDGRAPNRGTGGAGTVEQDAGTISNSSPTDDSALPGFKRYQTTARSFSNSSGDLGYYRHGGGTVDNALVSGCIAFQLPASLSSGQEYLFDWGSRGVQVLYDGVSERIWVAGENSSGASIAGLRSLSSGLVGGAWYALLFAIDTQNGERHFYLNESPDLSIDTVSTGESLDFSAGEQTIGVAGIETNVNAFDGAICHLGICTGLFLDFSKPAVRRRFFDKYNRPVYGGDDGSLAFGQQPEIWCPDGDGTRNAGSFGAFVLITTGAGSVSLADTYPTDA